MTRHQVAIFPRRVWPILGGRALPIWRGSDEWGRHTIVIQVPWIGGLVVATRRCRDVYMNQFRCNWPGCPYMSMSTDSYCPTHDREWLAP